MREIILIKEAMAAAAATVPPPSILPYSRIIFLSGAFAGDM
jgi:hypothetical protein